MTDQIDDLRFETKPMRLPSATASHRSVTSIVLLLCIPLGVGLALAAMYYSGAFAQLLSSPGALVQNGLPMVTAVFDGSAAVTIGLLVVSSIALPGQRKEPRSASFSQWYASKWAATAALVWLLSALATLAFTVANTLSVPFTSPTFRSQFLFVTFQLEIGWTWLATIGCILVAFVILSLTKNVSWLAVAAVFSVLAILPLSLSGHSGASTLEHVNAVNSLAMHLVGVTVWMGGLIAVILLRNKAGKHLATVVSRYSTLAIWAFAFVAYSGVINASLRITGPVELVTTTYGQLILIKSLILIGLGFAGWQQRRRVIPGLIREPSRRRSFVRLAVSEVVFMSIAMGLAVALSKSPPPVPQNYSGDTRSGLIGFPYPKPVDLQRFLFGFHPDYFFIAVALIMAGLYLVGVRKLRRRGDSWSWGRTAPWLVGCFGLVFATSGGPSIYGAVNFSTHMIQHMVLMMYVPPLLVLGAPILLALRTLPKRHDNSRGAREWILIITHSRYAEIITNPVVAAVIFAGSLVAFYYTGWFEASLQTHPGHFIMEVHFLLAGYLFFFVVIGVDPGPKRPPYPFRVILLMATLAFHAFFGLAIMTQTTVLASDWWHALGNTDTAALLADQHVGGAIAWGAGEFPTVLIALVVVRQWVRSDERIAKRYDRRADVDGDAELNAYNAQLQAMASHERRDPRA